MKVLFSGILKAVIDPTEPDGFFIEDIEQALDDIYRFWSENGGAPNPRLILLPKGAWHVTLIHQSILKPYRKELKELHDWCPGGFSVPPQLPAITDCSFGMRESGEGESYRKSFVLWFPDSYQKELKAYVLYIMRMIKADEEEEYYRFWSQLQEDRGRHATSGRSFFQSRIVDPEPERRFHISLANLTGKPGGSVR